MDDCYDWYEWDDDVIVVIGDVGPSLGPPELPPAPTGIVFGIGS